MNIKVWTAIKCCFRQFIQNVLFNGNGRLLNDADANVANYNFDETIKKSILKDQYLKLAI